ncbi:hypothetical protein SAMN02745127_00461 [Oceanospirillum multiglobuliferum]|uniref:Uncharacterized protein n=1 Tax=Oceanospirillum multiglobuliferum TaxID=64969 RepID=A0A1T4LGK9_9GAMM|nr:hypothetical protein [Oceanospirillum multiglobuliferum]OPX56670.1 hypothetical protein BTE48_01875 [Oceanospirillum multiglobuliferum]SJZ53728.1 hypothetical protein SAMN02745127_00461 [Oceanospirillum multiglobuliferum]
MKAQSKAYKTLFALSLLSSALMLSACGSGGSSGSTSENTESSHSPSTMSTAASITGTVPGTLIEAFGDNGSYYAVESTHTEDGRHPFTLNLPAGVGYRLVMTTNKGTADEVVTPIGFRDNTGTLRTRLMMGVNNQVSLGHIPLPMSRAESANLDQDQDGVLDAPIVLDDYSEAINPLLHTDADSDGIEDYNDLDHGGYQYTGQTQDPADHDHDGIHNHYDKDYSVSAGVKDDDRDGLIDDVNDSNPSNIIGANRYFDDDKDRNGYHDDDLDKDGHHDDDKDRDGYHDDLDKDGRHDSEQDHDTDHEDKQDHDD